MKKIQSLTAKYATHPGEIIMDELEARDIKQIDFAKRIDYPRSQLNEIIKGKRNINATLALMLEKELGINAAYWLTAQNNYDLDIAKIQLANKEASQAKENWSTYKSLVDIAYLKLKGFITGDKVKDIRSINNLYNANNSFDVHQVIKSYGTSVFFKKSIIKNSSEIATVSWIKVLEHKASLVEVSDFNAQLQNELISDLKLLFKDNKNLLAKCEALLASYGIKLIILDKPKGTFIDGIALWNGNKPTIGLSLRYHQLDKFAFALFHELGHVYLHLLSNHKNMFIEVENDINKNCTAEKEANSFAFTKLISNDDWQKILANKESIYKFNDKIIKQLAKTNDLHPAILKGLLCNHFQNFKFKSEIDSRIN
jgi:HTH-type transcriptional regulator / antitoxin HigA